MGSSPRLGHTAENLDEMLLDSHVGISYYGTLIFRPINSICCNAVCTFPGCCDLSDSTFRVLNYLKATKRLNPVAKKIPGTVELLLWTHSNFPDPTSMAGAQLWAALMSGFLFLRISEIGNLMGKRRCV